VTPNEEPSNNDDPHEEGTSTPAEVNGVFLLTSILIIILIIIAIFMKFRRKRGQN
jgi:flagellar biogenesis protein FliO